MFPVPHNNINVTVPYEINQNTIFRCIFTLHSQAKNGLNNLLYRPARYFFTDESIWTKSSLKIILRKVNIICLAKNFYCAEIVNFTMLVLLSEAFGSKDGDWETS